MSAAADITLLSITAILLAVLVWASIRLWYREKESARKERWAIYALECMANGKEPEPFVPNVDRVAKWLR